MSLVETGVDVWGSRGEKSLDTLNMVLPALIIWTSCDQISSLREVNPSSFNLSKFQTYRCSSLCLIIDLNYILFTQQLRHIVLYVIIS